jgi:hypothetical protein
VATDAEISAITKALNGVASAGQARAAYGAALRAANAAYPLLERLNDELAETSRHQLDNARVALENEYRSIESMSAGADYRETFQQTRRNIPLRVYLVIGGIEAAANYKPQTSNLAILTQSIKEAPAVFGQAAGEVVKQAGSVVGSAAGGILSGLGISGTVTLVVVAVVVLLVVTRGSLLRMFVGGSS